MVHVFVHQKHAIFTDKNLIINNWNSPIYLTLPHKKSDSHVIELVLSKSIKQNVQLTDWSVCDQRDSKGGRLSGCEYSTSRII